MVGDAVAAVAAVDEETAERAHRADRGGVRAAPPADVHRGFAGASGGAHPRVRRRAERAQGGVAAVRRRGGGLRRGRPRARGRLLLRGQHAPAHGAARRGGPVGRRRQAHALVLDPDAPLRAPAARQDPRRAAGAHPRGRGAGRRRLRRQARPVRPRDRGVQALPAHRPAGEVHADARGGLLRPPRPASGADVDQDRLHEGRRDHRHALPLLARRRRLRLLRRGLHLLYRRAPDRHLQDPGLQVRGRARVHQQAALRPQARARHAAAALRDGVPDRQGGRAARPRPGGHAAAQPGRAVREDRQPPDRDHDRPRRVHRPRGRGLRLAGEAREPAAGEGHRHRVLVVSHRARAPRSTGTTCRTPAWSSAPTAAGSWRCSAGPPTSARARTRSWPTWSPRCSASSPRTSACTRPTPISRRWIWAPTPRA